VFSPRISSSAYTNVLVVANNATIKWEKYAKCLQRTCTELQSQLTDHLTRIEKLEEKVNQLMELETKLDQLMSCLAFNAGTCQLGQSGIPTNILGNTVAITSETEMDLLVTNGPLSLKTQGITGHSITIAPEDNNELILGTMSTGAVSIGPAGSVGIRPGQDVVISPVFDAVIIPSVNVVINPKGSASITPGGDLNLGGDSTDAVKIGFPNNGGTTCERALSCNLA
jgi:hypothetical protein